MSFHAAVPGVVIGITVLIALAVGLIVFRIIRYHVHQCKTVGVGHIINHTEIRRVAPASEDQMIHLVLVPF